MSSTSFRLSHTRIGDKNYLGNNIHYPHDGKTGANVLLGTKTMIPIDGPLRANVGLLGSPPFEIPRAVSRDGELSASLDKATRADRLRRKNRHNLVTLLLWLSTLWILFFVTALGSYVMVLAFPAVGSIAVAAFGGVTTIAGILLLALTTRDSRLRRSPANRADPRPVFLVARTPLEVRRAVDAGLFKARLSRTPFPPDGHYVGRKVFDDGAGFVEKRWYDRRLRQSERGCDRQATR